MTTLKDVSKTNGWWLRQGDTKKPTHLLLDGGRLHIPQDSEDHFLNEYALVLVRTPVPPAVVELKTPIFRMFMDVDAKLAPGTHFDFDALWSSIFTASREYFRDVPRLVVCTAPTKTDENSVKHGAHLIWPTVYATSEIALGFRQFLVPKLTEEYGGDLFYNTWDDVIDACVYKANGLRMPWSVKGIGDARPYSPVLQLTAEGLQQVEKPAVVSALRTWIHDLNIRAHGKQPSDLQEGIEISQSVRDAQKTGPGRNQSLEPYRSMLPQVDEALPAEYKPHEFTSLFRTPHTVMLRSTSKYCRNASRHHASSTVYFVIQRTGLTQRCFCQKETVEGREYGYCRDFESETFSLPQDIIDTFLGAAAAAAACVPARIPLEQIALPSQKSKSAQNLNKLLGLSLMPRKKKTKK